jgi:hypothetical protein
VEDHPRDHADHQSDRRDHDALQIISVISVSVIPACGEAVVSPGASALGVA